MLLSFFLRGLIIGFSIAAPVGPIGVLCIRRTLTEGRMAGLLSGLGAATADALYGCIAGFGLTSISGLLMGQAFWVRLIGGLFLCYLGIKTLGTKPAEQSAAIESKGLMGNYVSTVFLTLTNPTTILSFAAVFAALGLGTTNGNGWTAMTLVAGVFGGSALWWLLLSSGVSLLRSRFNASRLKWLNRISGLILLGFGIIALSPDG
jgi:threonine/homoserine/homoserine lactone efflux protein